MRFVVCHHRQPRQKRSSVRTPTSRFNTVSCNDHRCWRCQVLAQLEAQHRALTGLLSAFAGASARRPLPLRVRLDLVADAAAGSEMEPDAKWSRRQRTSAFRCPNQRTGFPLRVEPSLAARADQGQLCFHQRSAGGRNPPREPAGGDEVASRPFAAGRERQLRSVLAAGITIEG